MRSDIIVRITYPRNRPLEVEIATNAKAAALEEILSCWIRAQEGLGRDESQPREEEVFTVEIRLDLSDDTFETLSNTGNNGLTAGLVMDVFERLSSIKVTPL